jgi:hypothetical protein
LYAALAASRFFLSLLSFFTTSLVPSNLLM